MTVEVDATTVTFGGTIGISYQPLGAHPVVTCPRPNCAMPKRNAAAETTPDNRAVAGPPDARCEKKSRTKGPEEEASELPDRAARISEFLSRHPLAKGVLCKLGSPLHWATPKAVTLDRGVQPLALLKTKNPMRITRARPF